MVHDRTTFESRTKFEGAGDDHQPGDRSTGGAPATPQRGYPRRWLAAIVMIVGALMDMIDVTIVNVALPYHPP